MKPLPAAADGCGHLQRSVAGVGGLSAPADGQVPGVKQAVDRIAAPAVRRMPP